MKLLHLFLFVAFVVPGISAQPPYTTLVASLLKHTNSSLYSITLAENYLIDLDSPFTLFRCDDMYPYPVACSSQECLQARSYVSPFCPPLNTSALPRQCFPCEDCWGEPFECESPCNRCAVTSVNPLTQSCALSQLTRRDLIVDWTNGRNPTGTINFNQLQVTCAHPSLFQSIPNNIFGIGSFSLSPLSLPSYFTPSYYGVANKFAICLPSSSRARGVSFFGDGPYYFLPKNQDLKTLLSYTPLLNSTKSPGYYIGLDGISINGKALPISLGNSSVKLSTIVPYTTLRSDVYKHFVKRFSKGVKNIPQVNAVSPFSLCLNATAIGFDRVGFRVPRINFHLGNGSIWSIFGPNSMKKVGHDVACLGFIDGGETAQEAVVIGSFQMENNFLYFDLENSMLGFSSTLLLERTSCAIVQTSILWLMFGFLLSLNFGEKTKINIPNEPKIK